MGKPRAITKKPDQSALVEAIKFVSIAQRKIGAPYQTHVIMSNRWLCAFDGLVTIATPIAEDIEACPHSARLSDALAKCGNSFSLIQPNENVLTVKAEINGKEFTAHIPCVPRSILHLSAPDDLIPAAPLGEPFRAAIFQAAPFASNDAQRPALGAVYVRANSCVATDGRVMLEAWHGFYLPPMMLPKAAADAICEAKKPLTGFGCSGNVDAIKSATFYFEDGSWIKTQMIEGSPADVDRILNVRSNSFPIPTGFFEAVKIIAPFNEHGDVIFGENLIRSHVEENIGATLEISGLPKGRCFNAKHLLSVQSFAQKFDFVGQNGVAYFFGDNVRGCIVSINVPEPRDPAIDAKIREEQERLKAERAKQPWRPGLVDDDIPF